MLQGAVAFFKREVVAVAVAFFLVMFVAVCLCNLTVCGLGQVSFLRNMGLSMLLVLPAYLWSSPALMVHPLVR